MEWAVVVVMMMVCADVPSNAFNLLSDHPHDFRGPAGAQFGFSVALWKDREGVKRVVIGAPLDNQTGWGNETFPLGSAYLCDPQDSGSSSNCSRHLHLLPKTNEKQTQTLISDYEFTLRNHGIGTGQTIITQKDRSHLFVCSPRYPVQYPNNGVYVNGGHYILKDPITDPVLKGAPKNTAFRGSLTGFSAASEEGNLVLGGPMAYNGCGLVLNCERDGISCRYSSKYQGANDNIAISKMKKKCPDSYEGWAVQLGHYEEAGGKLSIAASSPKSELYKGQVNFYPMEMQAWDAASHTILGREFGAFFGYALASADLDGDHVTDLVVGAPFATDEENTKYDVGKVFVYYRPLAQRELDSAPEVLVGRDPWGRFGMSLANLGDINDDRYEDVAIGAPYAGKDGSGVVFVYYGGGDGLRTRNPNAITSSEYMPGGRGFGFSLSGRLDMDDNGYPDIVIGALHSDAAVLIRASPVVRLHGSISFQPNPVNITGNLCNLELAGQKKLRGVCFGLAVNLRYTSIAEFDELKLKYEMELSTDRNSTKFGFYHNTDRRDSRDMRIYKTKDNRWTSTVFVQRARSNTNLTMAVQVTLKVESYKPTGLAPVLDMFQDSTYHASTQLVCENTTCHTEPDLALQVLSETVILGEAGMTMALNVSVAVNDDPAYGILVLTTYPGHLDYQSVDGNGVIPKCIHDFHKSMLKCTIEESNADEEINFWLTFRYKIENFDQLLEGLIFKVNVDNDEKTDKNMTNNNVQLRIPTKTISSSFPRGISEPESVVVTVNQTASEEKLKAVEESSEHTFPVNHLGELIHHVFSFTNNGPSPIKGAKLLFHVPLYRGDDRITYFMTQPSASHGITCTPLEVNPLGLQPPQSPASSSSSSSSSIATPKSVNNMKPSHEHERRKREVKETLTTLPSTDSSTFASSFQWTTDPAEYFSSTHDPFQSKITVDDNAIDCMEPRCLVKCSVDFLYAGDSIKVNFSSYLVTANINKLGMRKVTIKTWIAPEISQPGSTVLNPTISASTEMLLDKPPKRGFSSIPLWILIVAIVAAILVIIVIILALYKAGFFKRRRAPPMMNAQIQPTHRDHSYD